MKVFFVWWQQAAQIVVRKLSLGNNVAAYRRRHSRQPLPAILNCVCKLALSIFFTTIFVAPPYIAAQDAVNFVDTLVGSQKSSIGYGGTMPFVTSPFGMTDWTPQTRQNRISVTSYNYDDQSISGFIGTHQPAIWMGDYGYVTLMPEVGALRTTPEDRQLPFRHRQEVARPDYYRVTLGPGNGQPILAEMTATSRCAMFRFTFPRAGTSRILVEASRPGKPGHADFDTSTHEITGYDADRMDAHLGPATLPHFRGYFVIQFEQRPTGGSAYGGEDSERQSSRGAYAEFRPGQTVLARVGTSFLSIEQARANLMHEIPEWNFDEVRTHSHAEWNEKLSRLSVVGATQQEKVRLYSALYHSLLYPRQLSEDNRYYGAFDDQVHPGESYTAFSTWDTFRAENSLLTLLAPERIDGMISALLQDFREGGWMPKWPNPGYTNIMIATHADSLIAEAIRKAFRGFNQELAWQAVYKDAMVPPDGDTDRRWVDREEHTPYEARGGLTYYKHLGYIPTDKTDEAASSTLEDSYDDWCVAQIAKSLGHDTEYQFFLRRSLNDRHLYNPEVGLMNGKTSGGNWAPLGGIDDTPTNREVSGWTEGNAWVYTWSPLHDQAGLIALMGGENAYNRKLDEYFARGYNIHSNEPSHHFGYLYDFSGQPWKTQLKVREIAAREYGFGPGGLDGDDDCGQMSAWLLFTSLGFYPVNPASGEYMIGSPLYRRISLRLTNGKRLTVDAVNNSTTNVYIQSAKLNGRSLDVPVITWEQIQAGAILQFTMGPRPSSWGSKWRPSSVLPM